MATRKAYQTLHGQATENTWRLDRTTKPLSYGVWSLYVTSASNPYRVSIQYRSVLGSCRQNLYWAYKLRVLS